MTLPRTDEIREYIKANDMQGVMAEAVTKCVTARAANVNKFMAEYFAGKAKIALVGELEVEARALFAKADHDNDGNLTKTELKEFLSKTPELKKVFMKTSEHWGALFGEMDKDGDCAFSVDEWVVEYKKKMNEFFGGEATAEDVAATSAQVDAPSKKDKKKAAKEAKKAANKDAAPPAQQEGKKKKKGGAAELTPEEIAKAAAKKEKAAIKEGGKKGVEIEGACDMGGMQFFCTQLDEPDGDLDLLEKGFAAMNAECDPTEEERKGGAGNVGKVVFSAGSQALLMICNVPEDKLTDTPAKEEGAPPMKAVAADAWLKSILSKFSKDYPDVTINEGASSTYAIASLPANEEKRLFPVKLKDDAMSYAYAYLNEKNCMPADDDSDDDYIPQGDFQLEDY